MKSRLGGQRRHWYVTIVVKVCPFCVQEGHWGEKYQVNCSQTLVTPVMTANSSKSNLRQTYEKEDNGHLQQKTGNIWIFKVTSGLEVLQVACKCDASVTQVKGVNLEVWCRARSRAFEGGGEFPFESIYNVVENIIIYEIIFT